MADKIRIKVPSMVVIKNDAAKELRAVVEQMIDALVTIHEVAPEVATKAKMALYEKMPPAEKDYPISEFVDTILNTAPAFTGGHSKVQRLAYRLGQAFEGKREGDVIEIEPAAHDLLKAYFEKPEYVQLAEKGERKTVEGPWVFGAAVWRKCCGYVDAICEPAKVEPPAEPVPA